MIVFESDETYNLVGLYSVVKKEEQYKSESEYDTFILLEHASRQNRCSLDAFKIDRAIPT